MKRWLIPLLLLSPLIGCSKKEESAPVASKVTEQSQKQAADEMAANTAKYLQSQQQNQPKHK